MGHDPSLVFPFRPDGNELFSYSRQQIIWWGPYSSRPKPVEFLDVFKAEMWSLCIPYKKDGYDTSMYPDFIIIREDGHDDYKVDILEPHDPSRTDNLGKAKGLAESVMSAEMAQPSLFILL